MPLNEFWYGDIRLLAAYKKAYLSNTSYKAWLQGRYNFEAYSIVLKNAFAKKGTSSIDYPEWNAFTIQFDPVLCTNSRDSKILLTRFADMMKGGDR